MIPRLAACVLFVAGLAGCIGPVPTEVSVVRYPVRGKTFEALQSSWMRHGPRIGNDPSGAFAAVQPAFTSNFVPIQRGERCVFDRKGEVFLDAEVTLPEWKEEARAPADVKVRWDIYSSYAVIHEAGHIEIAQKYARRLKSYLRNASAPDCDLLIARMTRDTQLILDAHTGEQMYYDATDPARFERYRERYLQRLLRTAKQS
ncbi:MAG: hypothetical protein AcusKO_40450 [Acuticoccus sp.]